MKVWAHILGVSKFEFKFYIFMDVRANPGTRAGIPKLKEKLSSFYTNTALGKIN